MAFESLSQKLQDAFKKLSGRGKLSEKDVKEMMRQVRLALLEADVNYKITRDFVDRVQQKAVGAEILDNLNAAQQVVKIVNDELIELMGATNARLNMSSNPPTIIMLLGLQGAGKTTMAGKLGGYLKSQGKRPLLVACDIYRPAAIDQLKVVGGKQGLPVFELGKNDPVDTAKKAVHEAVIKMNDVVIIDTAGRLQIDEPLMDELKRIKAAVRPHEILLTVDAMTGQEAVNVAKAFDEALDITGTVLTKMDSDTRGGAALSIKAVVGKPIKFSGFGEKLNDIEPFYPDRVASRILGMGDMLTLIEKAQDAIDEKEAAELERKMRSAQFTLEDYLDQFKQMRKMGSVKDLLSMIPGIGGKIDESQIDESQLGRAEAIILSMTRKERQNPDILNASRRRRIAAGSGVTVQQVNLVLKQYEQTKTMMRQMMNAGKKGKRGFFGKNNPFAGLG